MARFTRWIAPFLVAIGTACSDATTAPPSDGVTKTSLDLVDSSQPSSPIPGFYFLVPNVSPPPATFTGTFDPDLSPVIDICGLASDNPKSPAECTGPKLATLSSSSPPPSNVTVDPKKETYASNWTATVTAGKNYRAFVTAGGRVLGYVDLRGVIKQKDAVPTGFVAVVVGSPFLFKFRIETGIAGSIAVTPATATLRDVDTPDESQEYTASVLDLHGEPLAGKSVDWSGSNASLVSLSPTSSTTSGSGQATTTASTIGRVSASTDVVITATLHGISGTATLTVLPTAARPIAVPNAYGVVAGKALVIAAPGVLGNDLDLDGDPLTVGSVTDNVDHGTLTLQPDGSFTYTPTAGYIGADAFTYTAVDPAAHISIPAIVTLEVLAPSDLGPVANDDHYAVVEGGTLSITAPGFLANDADPDDEPLTATLIVSNVTHGVLNAFGNGSFSYTPTAGYTGPDAFTYRMRDASGNTADATVTIDVVADPDKNPVAVADLYAVIEGTTLSAPAPGFLGNDGDPDGAALTATLIVSNVTHGVLNAFGNGSFSYTPTAGYTGTDAFTYRVRDPSGNTAEATVTFQVLPNSTTNPIANADNYVAFDGTILQISAPGFLANDLDPDGEPLTGTLIVSNVTHGVLSAFADGSFSYTSTAGYTGPDAFTYRMRDASGNTADATVTIQVLPDPDEQPIGLADTYTTFAGKTLSVAAAGFLANDIDPDGAALTGTAIIDNVDNGTLSAFADGSFTYTPKLGFTGTDAFAYQMRDASNHLSDPIVVTIEVRSDPNQPPQGLPDYFAMLGGTSLTIAAPGFIANDVDPEGETISGTAILDNVDNGTLSAFADGSFTYTPTAGFTGTDAFTYQIKDASNHLGMATVTIDVLDPAVAASVVAAGRVGSRETITSRLTGASGGVSEPLPVGSGLPREAAGATGMRLTSSQSSLGGAAPLPHRRSVTERPVPSYRVDPVDFAAGKLALPVARKGQR